MEGASGSIMNEDILTQIRKTNVQCIEELQKDFRIFPVDTSNGETREDPKRTAEVVAEAILGLVEGHVAEDILSCPKETITQSFGDNNFIGRDQAEALLRCFRDDAQGTFEPRDEVEVNASRVQALPIVVVRNQSGEVLRLRRRESSTDNPLHDKVVIWAGGHVRCEDAIGGDPIIHCVVREIEEELRLQIEPSSLQLIGAIYFDNGGSTSKHVAIAYEWRAPTNDVSVVLSRSEFFERRGTSLSGSFADVNDLTSDVKASKSLQEPWSVELIRSHFAKDMFEADLFANL